VAATSGHATSGNRSLELRLPAPVVVEDEAEVFGLRDIFFRHPADLEVHQSMSDSGGENQDVALVGVYHKAQAVEKRTCQSDQTLQALARWGH
jgi:hypothetical protein